MAGRFGALGDIHGDFDSARRIMESHPDVPFWVCVGDVGGDDGGCEPLPAPLYWIKGNNENFDAIADGALPDSLHFLPNGCLVTVAGIRIAGVGGTLAPTWYEMPAGALPHPKKGTPRATAQADKRRHFVRQEIEAAKALGHVHLLMTHEAPRPFRVGRIEAGKTPVNELLAALRPRLHLFGHHHRFTELAPGGVRSVGLDLVSQSYLLIDRETFEYERAVPAAPVGRPSSRGANH